MLSKPPRLYHPAPPAPPQPQNLAPFCRTPLQRQSRLSDECQAKQASRSAVVREQVPPLSHLPRHTSVAPCSHVQKHGVTPAAARLPCAATFRNTCRGTFRNIFTPCLPSTLTGAGAGPAAGCCSRAGSVRKICHPGVAAASASGRTALYARFSAAGQGQSAAWHTTESE